MSHTLDLFAHVRAEGNAPILQIRDILTLLLEASLAATPGSPPADVVAELLDCHRR